MKVASAPEANPAQAAPQAELFGLDEKTEIIPKNQTERLKNIEKEIEDALNAPLDSGDEIPIFDTQEIDKQVAQELTKTDS